MKVFLAGGETRHWIQDSLLENVKKNEKCRYILQADIRTELSGGGITKLLQHITLIFWNHSFMQMRTQNG